MRNFFWFVQGLRESIGTLSTDPKELGTNPWKVVATILAPTFICGFATWFLFGLVPLKINILVLVISCLFGAALAQPNQKLGYPIRNCLTGFFIVLLYKIIVG